MGKFKDIYEIIETEASKLATYKYTSIREFANITQDTIDSTILFLINSDNLQGTAKIPSRILNEFEFDIWIIKNHKLESLNIEIAEIQDSCLAIMNNFIWAMQQPNVEYFPIESWTFKMVRNTTPNAFAGVRFTMKLETACNL